MDGSISTVLHNYRGFLASPEVNSTTSFTFFLKDALTVCQVEGEVYKHSIGDSIQIVVSSPVDDLELTNRGRYDVVVPPSGKIPNFVLNNCPDAPAGINIHITYKSVSLVTSPKLVVNVQYTYL